MHAKDFTVYRDAIFNKKIHLHFNTPVSFTPSAKTDFHHADFKQSFKPSSNFKFGLTGMCNFNTHYSLSFGMNLIWFSFNSMRSDFFIPAKYTEMYVSPDPVNYRGDLTPDNKLFTPYNYFWTVPVNFIHRIPLSNKLDFRYGIGIDLKVYANFEYTASGRFRDINNDSLPIAYYFDYVVSPDRKRSLKLDALFSAGINRYLKNNKIINCNFFVSVPMYKPLRGEFGFLLDTPYEAQGTFKKSDLAFGFEFNYIFTFVKKSKKLPGVKPGTKID